MATRTRERTADEAPAELAQPAVSAASKRRSRPSLPPGPKTPRLLNMLRYARNPYEALARNNRFGDCGTTRMPGQPPIVGFTDPQAIKEIFAEDPDVLRSGEAMSTYLGPIVGWNSLLVLDGERWRRERRLMQPPFHGERMHNYATTISEITNDVVDEWPIGRPFPIHAQMQKITLEVIMRVVFGVEEADQVRRLRWALDRFLSLLNSPTAAVLLFPLFHVDLGRFSPWGRFVRYRRDVEIVLSQEIRRRRAEGTDGRTDVLSMLIAARDEDGQSMSKRELLDEMFTLLGAGHETTATTLAWAFYHLLPRSDVLGKLREELTREAGAGSIEPQHLGELKYVDAVIDETMRLTPVATAIMRASKLPSASADTTSRRALTSRHPSTGLTTGRISGPIRIGSTPTGS